MGSGGMVVVDDTTCMVDFAKFFLKFTAEESCGKCVPCRVGSTRMLEILERISRGEATVEDIEPARAPGRRRGRGLALRPGRQRPQPGARHPALLQRRGHGPRRSSIAARPGYAGRSSATGSTRRPAPVAGRASAPARAAPSPGSASSRTSSTRSSASSATPAARPAGTMPSRVGQRSTRAGRREAADEHECERPMPTAATTTCSLTINGTSLQAARVRPCWTWPAAKASTSRPCAASRARAAWGGCRLCLVEVDGVDKLQAACTTWVADGMSVQTETPRVRARRESYLRMYLSDHNSYCEAPCTHACPTHVDIPGIHGGPGRRRRRRRGRHRA